MTSRSAQGNTLIEVLSTQLRACTSVSDGIAPPVEAELGLPVIDVNYQPVFTNDPIFTLVATNFSAFFFLGFAGAGYRIGKLDVDVYNLFLFFEDREIRNNFNGFNGNYSHSSR